MATMTTVGQLCLAGQATLMSCVENEQLLSSTEDRTQTGQRTTRPLRPTVQLQGHGHRPRFVKGNRFVSLGDAPFLKGRGAETTC